MVTLPPAEKNYERMRIESIAKFYNKPFCSPYRKLISFDLSFGFCIFLKIYYLDITAMGLQKKKS